jgi:hypothetical protein
MPRTLDPRQHVILCEASSDPSVTASASASSVAPDLRVQPVATQGTLTSSAGEAWHQHQHARRVKRHREHAQWQSTKRQRRAKSKAARKARRASR